MLVLIDESGDPGFKLDRGSSRHFVAAMVVFHDFKEAENCAATIDALRRGLGFSHEFKFNKCSAVVKDAFFAAVVKHQFEVRALVVDKTMIRSENLKRSDERFYSYFVKSLLRHDGGTLQNASVKIDGSGDREFKRELGAYLRKNLQQHTVHKVRFADSANDSLIQLADMAVGAIARSYRLDEERNKAQRWARMLGPKITDIWDFK